MSFRLLSSGLLVLAAVLPFSWATGEQERLNDYRQACPNYVTYAASPQYVETMVWNFARSSTDISGKARHSVVVLDVYRINGRIQDVEHFIQTQLRRSLRI